MFVTAPRHPSVDKQFGHAYVEAMASGLPVVTPSAGSNHEAVRPPNLRAAQPARPTMPKRLRRDCWAFSSTRQARAEVGAHNRRAVLERHELRRQRVRLGEIFRAHAPAERCAAGPPAAAPTNRGGGHAHRPAWR
jgi:glycosyltransferase involved in cell wall biosynthesis